MGEQRTKKVSQEDVLAEAEKQLEKIKKAKDEVEEKKQDQKTKKSSEKSKANKTKRAKKRSTKYQEAVKKFDKLKFYNLEDALVLLRKINYSKFDASIDLSINSIKKKSQQPIRTMLDLPYGSGKKANVIILDEEKIEAIRRTKKIDFDIAIATPALMGRIAKIAKILGPKGKMPNPKSGTISQDPQKTKKELEEGKVEIKEDTQGIIHQVVGKVSWDDKKILENIKALLRVLPKNRLKSIIISSTMSPGIKIKL